MEKSGAVEVRPLRGTTSELSFGSLPVAGASRFRFHFARPLADVVWPSGSTVLLKSKTRC